MSPLRRRSSSTNRFSAHAKSAFAFISPTCRLQTKPQNSDRNPYSDTRFCQQLALPSSKGKKARPSAVGPSNPSTLHFLVDAEACVYFLGSSAGSVWMRIMSRSCARDNANPADFISSLSVFYALLTRLQVYLPCLFLACARFKTDRNGFRLWARVGWLWSCLVIRICCGVGWAWGSVAKWIWLHFGAHLT